MALQLLGNFGEILVCCLGITARKKEVHHFGVIQIPNIPPRTEWLKRTQQDPEVNLQSSPTQSTNSHILALPLRYLTCSQQAQISEIQAGSVKGMTIWVYAVGPTRFSRRNLDSRGDTSTYKSEFQFQGEAV